MPKVPTLAELAVDLAPEARALDNDIAALIAERPENGPHLQWVLAAVDSGGIQPKNLDAAASILLHMGTVLGDDNLIALAARIARASVDVDTLARAHTAAQHVSTPGDIPIPGP